MPSWFGDYTSLCSSCIPLPTCNLLNETLQTSFVSPYAVLAGAPLNQCLLSGSSVRDLGTAIVSSIGLLYVVRQVLYKSYRRYSAVGRIEMSSLFLMYTIILLLQIFTIGGVLSKHKTFMIWASAVHLGAIVCFFWIMIINALILFQFVDDGTKYTIQFIVVTCILWMVGVVFISLDLAMDITGDHHGKSPVLFFLTSVFPAVAALLYMIFVGVLVFRRLDVHKPLVYIAIAVVIFAISQVVLFGGSNRIALATHSRVNGSMFATLLDLLGVVLLYKFWDTITDDTLNDCFL